MLTQSQIDQYHRDGFLVIRHVFAGEELAQLRQAADAVVAEGKAHLGENHLYREVHGEQRYFRSEKMWSRDDIFKAVTVKPELLAAIGQCMGEPFLPINDSFVCKTPRSMVPIQWHQDPPYGNPKWGLTQAAPNFDTDIYLDHSTVENGCVWGIPGHHLVGHVDLASHSEEELFNDFGAVPIEMEPGDVLFHSLSAPHGSVGNPTDTTRRIFYVHYMSRIVLEQCYAEWIANAKADRGWNDDGFDLVESMLAARADLGYGTDLEAAHIRYRRGAGFDYAAEPATPFRHWGTLIEQMSNAEIQAKKQLSWQPQLA